MIETLSTLIFAGIAIFVAFRLYSTLGRREGHMEAPPARDLKGRVVQADGSPAHLRAAFEGRAAAGLESIAAADSSFDPVAFLEGAKAAYTLIVTAFARGDVAALRSLLADKVYDRYAEAISGRQAREETVRTEIERIKSAEILEASHEAGLARVKVGFETELATETTGKDGERISGDFSSLNTVRENWTFERRTDSADPNWVLAGVAAV
jgi:predicted lipid-binding transport protein (Tim44 family)